MGDSEGDAGSGSAASKHRGPACAHSEAMAGRVSTCVSDAVSLGVSSSAPVSSSWLPCGGGDGGGGATAVLAKVGLTRQLLLMWWFGGVSPGILCLALAAGGAVVKGRLRQWLLSWKLPRSFSCCQCSMERSLRLPRGWCNVWIVPRVKILRKSESVLADVSRCRCVVVGGLRPPAKDVWGRSHKIHNHPKNARDPPRKTSS